MNLGSYGGSVDLDLAGGCDDDYGHDHDRDRGHDDDEDDDDLDSNLNCYDGTTKSAGLG